jgi:hypothetical protein
MLHWEWATKRLSHMQAHARSSLPWEEEGYKHQDSNMIRLGDKMKLSTHQKNPVYLKLIYIHKSPQPMDYVGVQCAHATKCTGSSIREGHPPSVIFYTWHNTKYTSSASLNRAIEGGSLTSCIAHVYIVLKFQRLDEREPYHLVLINQEKSPANVIVFHKDLSAELHGAVFVGHDWRCAQQHGSQKELGTLGAQISQSCNLGWAVVVAVSKCVHSPPLLPPHSGKPWILIALFKLYCLAYQGKVAVQLSTRRSILMLTPQ